MKWIRGRITQSDRRVSARWEEQHVGNDTGVRKARTTRISILRPLPAKSPARTTRWGDPPVPVLLYTSPIPHHHWRGRPDHAVPHSSYWHLDPSWKTSFDDLQIVHEAEGTTLLIGQLPDQAALYGVLLTIRRLGLSLLSLETSETSAHEEPEEAN
jgi:hypothetical protein